MEGTPGAPSTPGGEGEGKFSRSQQARWWAALIVALLGAAYFFVAAEEVLNCRDALTRSGEVVQLCEGPELVDLMPFVVVIAVLLAPDLSELGIIGLFSMKRRVSEQEGRQERMEAKLSSVEQRVEQKVAVANSSSVSLHTMSEELEEKLKAALPTLAKARQDAEEAKVGKAAPEDEPEDEGPEVGGGSDGPKPEAPEDGGGAEPPEEAEEAEEGEQGAPASPPEQVSEELDQRASLTLQMLYLAKNIEQYEAISKMRLRDPKERMATLTEEQQMTVDRWYVLFKEEIMTVRQVRNQLAHNPYTLSIEELEDGVRIGRRLLRLLFEGIGAPHDVIEGFSGRGDV